MAFLAQEQLGTYAPSQQVDATSPSAASTLAHNIAALVAPTASSFLGADLHGLATIQPKLLKLINSLTSKEELFNYIEHCHHLLDPINLVTCLYRLARMYGFTQNEQKAVWKAELLRHPSFTLLLDMVHRHLVRAQAILSTQTEVPGLNARCLSNLLWSIVKLEVVGMDDGHPMALDVALASVPLVHFYINDCSGQGLANLLWSFGKIPSSPPQVLVAIVERMVELLQQPASAAALDAQALSNAIWAIAHVGSKASSELDSVPGWSSAVTSFLLLMANQTMALLTSATKGGGQQRRFAAAAGNAEGRFSCQAVANIVWSLSTILGSACGVEAPMRPLFLLIRQLAIARLQCAPSGSSPNHSLSAGLTGSFNEQALSNLAFAYQTARLLSPELLQAVFDAAALRLERTSASALGPLGFQPEELRVLLRCCHLGVAQPWTFLHAVSRVFVQYPALTSGWADAELMELHQALQLLGSAVPAVQGQHSAAEQPALVPALLPFPLASNPSAGSYPARPRQQFALNYSSAAAISGGYMSYMSGAGVYMQQQQQPPELMVPSTFSTMGSSMPALWSASPQPSVPHLLTVASANSSLSNQHHLPPPTLPSQCTQGQSPVFGMYNNMPGSVVMLGAPLHVTPPLPLGTPMQAALNQPQDAASVLQQVWLVDPSGNLQATTVLLPANLTARVPSDTALGSGTQMASGSASALVDSDSGT